MPLCSNYSVVFQAGRPATANSDCKNGLMFPNEVFTRQFTVSRISSGAGTGVNGSSSVAMSSLGAAKIYDYSNPTNAIMSGGSTSQNSPLVLNS